MLGIGVNFWRVVTISEKSKLTFVLIISKNQRLVDSFFLIRRMRSFYKTKIIKKQRRFIAYGVWEQSISVD
jgi:hypothetical protein